MYLRLDMSPTKKKRKINLNTKFPNFDFNTKFDYSDHQIPRMYLNVANYLDTEM